MPDMGVFLITLLINYQHRISAEKICNHKLEKESSVRDFMEVSKRGGGRGQVQERQREIYFLIL